MKQTPTFTPTDVQLAIRQSELSLTRHYYDRTIGVPPQKPEPRCEA